MKREQFPIYVCLSACVITTLDKADQVKIDILSKSIIEKLDSLEKIKPKSSKVHNEEGLFPWGGVFDPEPCLLSH